MVFKRLFITLSMVLLLHAGWGLASAQSPMEEAAKFYKGKTIRFLVVMGPGGGFDLVARVIAPYLKKYTGATVVVENMPAAGGLAAANYLYEKADRDGLTILIMQISTQREAQLLGDPLAHYDLLKMNAIGNTRASYYQIWIKSDLPYKSFNDLVASGKTVRFACTTQSSVTYWIPEMILKNAGVKAAPVRGYKGSAEEALAIVRGEVEACVNLLSATPFAAAFKDGTIRPIITFAPERIKELPDVPTIYEETKLPEDVKFWLDFFVEGQKLWAPIYTNQDVPRERVQFLRDALRKCMEDKELFGKLEVARVDPSYTSGEEVEQTVKTWLRADPARVKYFKKVLGL